ncbi:M20 family metallo-hydrolase [Halocatena marina]|uniref:M20 family metallo-hydrolase n=1 Tax=Halocatena marina TaxID=2934937 RepID=A0ABD5YNN1_9EURY|nr:M20 family metallo-hydrolase [Halocatena marina]
MDISTDRLRTDIETTATFGTLDGDGHGRTVLTGSDANQKAREYFLERLDDAGLSIRIDSVGNIVGRWEPEGASGAPVASGSHLDSVPEGGIFDGPLGVYAALESVRAMQDADRSPERPIDVVSFTEEEGTTFSSGLLGSSVACGQRSIEEALSLSDDTGQTLETALEEIGFCGTGRLDASTWDAWLELHIEQHIALERANPPAGVVTDITGITHCDVHIEGEANHAGSTPMDERTDALAAAGEFVTAVENAARAASERAPAVGTVGRLTVEPNATNVIPERVSMGVDIRSTEYESMNAIVEQMRQTLEQLTETRGVNTTCKRHFDLEPVAMSERCQRVLHDAGERATIETMTLHSGAAHDTMHIARVTDSGMLFAPSCAGISHSPQEWTDWDDCASATTVLAGALAELAGAT